MSLESETKKAMGFIERPRTCKDCIFMEETENKYVDRMWDKRCTFSPLCKFDVQETSTCSKFEGKQ